MDKRGCCAALLLAWLCVSGDAWALSRRMRAEDAARKFVPAFCTKHYERAATVATFDPAARVEWFEKSFATNEPFTHFRIWDVDDQGDDSLVYVRISGVTVVHGLYLRVDSEGRVAEMLSIRDLLEWRKPELDSAARRTLVTLDAIESGELPPASIRAGLQEHRRVAAQYLEVLDRHLQLLEGEPALTTRAYR